MHIEEIKRDLDKQASWAHQNKPIVLRKGETGETQIKVTVTDNGLPASISGYKATFYALLQDGSFVKDADHVSLSGNVVTYTVQSDLTSVDGEVAVAYIELTSGVKTITTDTIPFIVLRNTDMSQQEAERYENIIDSLTKQLKDALLDAEDATRQADEALEEASEALGKAEAAASLADQAVKDANEAASNANDAAKSANDAAASANSAASSAMDAVGKVDEAMESFVTIESEKDDYQLGDNGTSIPTGEWQASVTPEKGKWLWHRHTTTYNQGNPAVTYTAVYEGRDGEFVGEERLEDLEEKVNEINDLTTGINLLRGTRDFHAGTNKYLSLTDVFTDGFNIPATFTVSRDSDGFGVVTSTKSASSIYVNSSIFDVVEGEELTVSFDFKADNPAVLTENGIAIVVWRNASGAQISSTQITIDRTALAAGKWVAVKATVKAVTGAVCATVTCRCLANWEGLSYKKMAVVSGKINNPIWSASPFDVVPITGGGTNATDAAGARNNLSVREKDDWWPYVGGLNNLLYSKDSTYNTLAERMTGGYLNIVLPLDFSKGRMVKFTIAIYNYMRGSANYTVAGYIYPSYNRWFSVYAWCEASVKSVDSENSNGIAYLPVIFGATSDGKAAVSIGTPELIWGYTNVVIKDIQCPQGSIDELRSGWKISVSESLVTTVHRTVNTDQVFVPATTSADGSIGYVPKPSAGDQNKFLRGDGTWVDIIGRLSAIEAQLGISSPNAPESPGIEIPSHDGDAVTGIPDAEESESGAVPPMLEGGQAIEVPGKPTEDEEEGTKPDPEEDEQEETEE